MKTAWVLRCSNSPDVRLFATKELAQQGMAACCRKWINRLMYDDDRDAIDRLIQQEKYDELQRQWAIRSSWDEDWQSQFFIDEEKILETF